MDRPNQLQAGLVLHQGYMSEKHCANQTRSFHLKQCIFCGLGDWKPHPIVYNYSTKELSEILTVLLQIEHKLLQANLLMAFVNNLFTIFKWAY
jgi:hypothetical protein